MNYDDKKRTNENEDNNSEDNKEDKESAEECTITKRICRTHNTRAVMSN